MDLVQLKIKDQKNINKYIFQIRKFDSSLPINQIKHNIIHDNFVVTFDLHYFDVLEDLENIDKKVIFRNLITTLIDLGADVEIYHNGELTTLEFLDNWLNTINEIKREVELDIDRELGEEYCNSLFC